MEKTDIESAIRDILSKVLIREISEGENVSAESEVKWDSLKHVEIIFSVEDHLDVQFEEFELSELNSLEALVKSVQRHHEA